MPLLGRVLGSCSGKGATTVCCIVVHMLCGPLYCMSCNMTSLRKDIARSAAGSISEQALSGNVISQGSARSAARVRPGPGNLELALSGSATYRYKARSATGTGKNLKATDKLSLKSRPTTRAACPMRARQSSARTVFSTPTSGEKRQSQYGPEKNGHNGIGQFQGGSNGIPKKNS